MAFLSTLNADKITKETLACPTVDKLKKAPTDVDSDSLALSIYTVANDCVLLFKNSEVEAVGYDPRNSTEIFQEILDKNSGKILYILRSSIYVEQDGKKAALKF